MGKWALWGLLLCGLVFSTETGCGTADNRVDPGDLELRDLLGISPEVARKWGQEQREAARRVIDGSLAADDEVERFGASVMVAPYRDAAARDVVVAQALARWDERLAREGARAVTLLRVAVAPGVARATVRPTLRTALGARALDIEGSADFAMKMEGWNDEPLADLAERASSELRDLARDAGHGAEPLLVVPSGRLTVLAAYVEREAEMAARLLVNPVMLAAVEPEDGRGADLGAVVVGDEGEGGASTEGGETGGGGGGGVVRYPDNAGGGGGGGAVVAPGLDSKAIGGNPYSFYGSVAECAYAQRLRCERCLGNSSCEPITDTTDGNAECMRFAESGGRGYFLQCINLSLAITSVNRCAAESVSSCARSPGAANSLSTLEANATFLDEESCGTGLDVCLAKIYGKPDGDYPGPGGGDGPPPRDIDVDCGQSCDGDDNNGNCEASPTCEGPSCNNSFSCDSTCSSSNDQSSGCSSDNNGGDCGSCSSDSGGGEGGSSCSSDDGGSSSGGGCGGDSDSGGDGCGGGSGDSGCGGSGGGGCGGGSGDSGCGGSGGDSSSKCSVAMPLPRDNGRPPAALSFLLMGLWGLAPIPAVMLARRRATRVSPAKGEEVAR